MLGSRIRERRHQLGLSQDDLADLANVAQKMISRYENGLSSPTAETIITLAGALQTSADYLLGLTDSPNPYEPSAMFKALHERITLETILKTPVSEVLKKLGYTTNGESKPKTPEAQTAAYIIDRMPEEDRRRAVKLLEVLISTSASVPNISVQPNVQQPEEQEG